MYQKQYNMLALRAGTRLHSYERFVFSFWHYYVFCKHCQRLKGTDLWENGRKRAPLTRPRPILSPGMPSLLEWQLADTGLGVTDRPQSTAAVVKFPDSLVSLLAGLVARLEASGTASLF